MKQSIKNKLILAVVIFVLFSAPAVSLAAKKYIPTPEQLQPKPENSSPNYQGNINFSSGENPALLPLGGEAGGGGGNVSAPSGLNGSREKESSSAAKTRRTLGFLVLIALCAGALLGYVYVRKGKKGKD